ncbi:hypothetical protein CGRA01v4_11794 [Colletotrichum graminicola]|uniref:Uncharacterized protein n=1 Tax=Colletotrichum graminicola (strain M1.001 / M2 / FGSC 10212) TaxID=645133 RepID=E3QBW5_COLGM|nr:uncharacterized protein GLRG_03344 [Colletotrichum graminicola M1.001]EFQ28200.1 hypothetical protein GLRG_03344 [Colletotrichum graminicola M1.001]WDK20507.1 hypothetical protein CGRA01v4_11794 [Colletotrichum graminicola]
MSTNGHAILQTIQNKVASRTIQVTVVPRPTKFAERRAVLHSLQQFAKVEVFKKLDNHPSSFISVLSDKAKVKELVKISPLQYQLATPQTNGSVKTFLTSSASAGPFTNPAKHYDDEVAAHTEDRKDFTVHIFPAPTYIHSAAIKASPLHGPWPKSRRETVMSATLKESIPKNVAADGLSDWETGGQVKASGRGQLWEDILLGTKSNDVRKRAIIDRIQRREKSEKAPAIMEGLFHLRQEANKP